MRRPTLIILLIFFAIILGFGSRNRGVVVLALPLITYLGMAIHAFGSSQELEVQRTILPQRGDPTTDFEIDLKITNRGDKIDLASIEDELPSGLRVVQGDHRALVSLPTKETIRIEYKVRGLRSLYKFSRLNLIVHDRLGLFNIHKQLFSPGEFFVLPEINKLKRVNIQPKQTQMYSGIIPSNLGGQGVEFFSVRKYQPGDPVQHLNWKIISRQDNDLYTNIFKQERVADVRIILDARARNGPLQIENPIFDHCVNAAASIIDVLIHEGNRIGLLIYGKYLDISPPGYGKIQRERLLRALSRAEAGYSPVFERLDYIPMRFLPIESQIILISPLNFEDLNTLIGLSAKGYRIKIISPNPIKIYTHASKVENEVALGVRIARLERDLLLSRLRRRGVVVVDWDTEAESLAQALGKRSTQKRPYPLRVIP
jgi:uncharacterized protein (DUF58 family)